MRFRNYRTFILVVSLGIFCALTGICLAHAFPDHSDPRVGTTVSDPPSMVRIWFDGDIEPVFSKITVQTMDGRKVDKGDSRVDPKDSTLLEVTVPTLPPGQYRVTWSVIARDGHHTEGQYTFTVK